MDELVSIITPTYNSEKFIADTVQSIQNQTYPNWEMIIVDDCSTDKTVEIVNIYVKADPRIKIISLPINQGTGVARNTGLNFAKGRYISFVDADDLWMPNKLETQLAFMKSKGLSFTFSFYDCIDDEGNGLNKTVEAPEKLSYKQLFFCNYIGNLTAIYDASVLGKIPIEATRKRQDWMLWLTIVKKIKVAQPVPEILALYRVRKSSISSAKVSLLKHNFNVYRDFHKRNAIASFFCMVVFIRVHFLVKPKYTRSVK